MYIGGTWIEIVSQSQRIKDSVCMESYVLVYTYMGICLCLSITKYKARHKVLMRSYLSELWLDVSSGSSTFWNSLVVLLQSPETEMSQKWCQDPLLGDYLPQASAAQVQRAVVENGVRNCILDFVNGVKNCGWESTCHMPRGSAWRQWRRAKGQDHGRVRNLFQIKYESDIKRVQT